MTDANNPDKTVLADADEMSSAEDAAVWAADTGELGPAENAVETATVDPAATESASTEPTRPKPFVRERPVHKTVEAINDIQEDEDLAVITHDSAYSASRVRGTQLRRDLHYGQYLEIPKGRRDIFIKRERKSRILTFIALVLVIAVLVFVVHYVWDYMQVNWGASSTPDTSFFQDILSFFGISTS